MEWTQSQLDAISARRGTVLVAAAAGSGKTAVLVRRALARLVDPEHPTPANRLLIVTFTKAAAAEMRARLERELSNLQRQNPGSSLLRRQSILLHQASIGTVDSFCAEMVREFFHLLDLSPEFKILSDRRQEDMIRESLEEALARAYDSGEAQPLADAFAGGKDDRRLMEMTRTLYDFMQSHPFPERWLREKAAMYTAGDSTPWERVILDYVAESANFCAGLLANGLELCRDDPKVEKAFTPALATEHASFAAISEAAEAGDWDLTLARIDGFQTKRQGSLSKADYDGDPLVNNLKALRKTAKDRKDELKTLLSASREDCLRELAEAAPLLEGLARLTLDFTRIYAQKKLAKNFLDYSDLEHCAIRLFRGEDGLPTPAAREVSARYDEIMIDEFQDTNEVQDSIFRAISRDEGNLFMVGDVKQSIYGFRQARPDIFLRCRRSYEKYSQDADRYPAYIVLDRNFRSRQEVTDAVNFVFTQLMSRRAGDIDYTGEERLVCGADFPALPGRETELEFLERGSVPAETAEPAWIARRIRELVESGFTVTEGGAQRPARWGDFCVLLRSANKYAHLYAREMERLGVPARATVGGGFFAAAEIQTMLSLLRVIDNPNQDIPLLATLMSPLYGFSADDAARLRAPGRDVSMYVSLVNAAQTDPRCQRVVKELGRLRDLAAAMPADRFLTMLYGRTGCTDMVLAMEDGPARLGNLQLLQRCAQEYESSGYHGLSGFVRFLDRLRDNGDDIQGAKPQPGGSGAVSVMSIHNSKGLQFPVCIVAGCGRQFVSDGKNDVLLHPELGLGVKLKDLSTGARYTTTAREAIALETARSSGAEELRVLYVAMTRAQEKLILVSSVKDLDAALKSTALEPITDKPSSFAVRRAKSAGEWLLMCALRHPDGGELRRRAGIAQAVPTLEETSSWKIGFSQYQPEESPAEPKSQTASQPMDVELYQRLKARVDFAYPHTLCLDIPAKVSASKLSAEQSDSRELNLSRPAWLGAQGMTPAQRGIALHEFMQYADFPAAARDPQVEIQRLANLAYLTQEQAAAIDVKRVRAFFSGSLGRRVLASPEVVKERRFTAVLPPSMAFPQAELSNVDEPVILQGAVDCTFMEDGKLHIIDFKTDRVEDMEELWQRYGVQIQLYAYAMEEVTGCPVGDMILYSTWLSQSSGRAWLGAPRPQTPSQRNFL